jgi:phage protein D
MLNTIATAGSGNQPRSIVRLGGTPVGGVIEWEASNNSYYEADTFSVSFAIAALPSSNNLDWFSQQTEIFVEILAGYPANPDRPDASELSSLFYGRVDNIDPDFGQATVTITGRDLTAAFIDKKLTSEYQNQTASSVVTTLAQSHGLSTDQITATSTKIGIYFRNEQVRMQANRSEWDFIAWLAREEGFVAYVTAKSLYFGPDPRDTSNPYVIRWSPTSKTQASPSANAITLKTSRSLTVAKGITVTVRSASLTTNTPVVQSYPGNAKTIQAGKASPFGAIQTYYFNAPAGLSPTQAQQYAERKYKEIISHAMKLEGSMPADLILSVTTPMSLEGTGTSFDQVYFPRLVSRRMSEYEGFVMNFEAQNTTPELEQAAD